MGARQAPPRNVPIPTLDEFITLGCPTTGLEFAIIRTILSLKRHGKTMIAAENKGFLHFADPAPFGTYAFNEGGGRFRRNKNAVQIMTITACAKGLKHLLYGCINANARAGGFWRRFCRSTRHRNVLQDASCPEDGTMGTSLHRFIIWPDHTRLADEAE